MITSFFFAGRFGRCFGAILILLSVFPLSVDAAGRHHAKRSRGQVDPKRGQYDFIRRGLNPEVLPYTHQGLWGWDYRYPNYPVFHGDVPRGPGDCLYETGRFPWERG